MRVRIIQRYRYSTDHINAQEAVPGDVLDLPDWLAMSCVRSRHGALVKDAQAAETKPSAPAESKPVEPIESQQIGPEEAPLAEPAPLVNDLTLLPQIGEANQEVLRDLGVNTYMDFLHLAKTDEGREILIDLPRVQPKHIPAMIDMAAELALAEGQITLG